MPGRSFDEDLDEFLGDDLDDLLAYLEAGEDKFGGLEEHFATLERALTEAGRSHLIGPAIAVRKRTAGVAKRLKQLRGDLVALRRAHERKRGR